MRIVVLREQDSNRKLRCGIGNKNDGLMNSWSHQKSYICLVLKSAKGKNISSSEDWVEYAFDITKADQIYFSIL